MSTIVRMESENVMRLKAVSITPQGSVVVIGGKNGQGKTSVLDSITYALGGKGELASQPVRVGEESARVVVETQELTITRIIKADGKSSLKVTTKDGAAYGAPQTILDRLVGELSFDPLAFARMDGKGQLATLRRLTGINTDELDAEHAKIFALRTDTNRVVKGHEAVCAKPPIKPTEPVANTADLVKEQREAQAAHRAVEELEDAHETQLDDIETATNTEIMAAKQRLAWAEEIKRIQKQISDSEIASASAAALIDRMQATSIQQQSAITERKAALPDLDAIANRLAGAGAINAQHAAYDQHLAKVRTLELAQRESKRLTAQLESISKQKAELIAAAAFPVPGLGFGENGVTYNGIPFDQASSAEQLRVSVAMGLAANPELKVILIRDGSLLDADNLALIGQMAEEAEAQIWIERVGEGEEASVIIEDGMVKD